MVFWGLSFFQVVTLLWFVFCVSGKVAEVLKMLGFSSFLGAFVAWLILVYLGLEGLGVFVVLVFVFLWFGFVLVCLLSFCFVVGLFLVWFLFFFCVFVFCFSFLFEGLRVR